MVDQTINSSWLIIDDDFDVVAIISEFLNDHNIPSICCSDPRKVKMLLEQHAISGIICDFVMPHLNGFQVHDLVRATSDYQKIPFVLLSGRADVAYDDRFSDQANTFFFSKPIDFEKLIKLISRYLKPQKLLIDPEDYRSLEVEGMISTAKSDGPSVPVVLLDFSSDLLKFEVKHNTIKTGQRYSLDLQCECEGEMVSLAFSGNAVEVSPVDCSEVDQIVIEPIDLNQSDFDTIANTYREKQLYINHFLQMAKGII